MDLTFFIKNWNSEKINLIIIWFAKNAGFESKFGYNVGQINI